MRTLAHAGLRLGVDIEENDNHLLFLEAARWIGTPYKNGGNTQTGIDCSGLSCQIYKNVFHTNLPRQSEKQYRNAQLKPGKRLKQGDLLFFKVSKMRKNKCDHVGIYLKEYKFIHASSSKGVIVSSLTDPYWTNCWISAGSYKK